MSGDNNEAIRQMTSTGTEINRQIGTNNLTADEWIMNNLTFSNIGAIDHYNDATSFVK